MAEGFTTSKASSILQSVISSSKYVCLSTTTPNKDGGNFTEPSPTTTGYRRAPFGKVNTSIAAQVANDDIIFIFESTGACGTFTHVGISDNSSVGSGVFLMGELNPSVTVEAAGYVPLIRAKKFVVGLDKEALESYG